jgi:hypothetical protein
MENEVSQLDLVWDVVQGAMDAGEDADEIADCVAMAIRQWQLDREPPY